MQATHARQQAGGWVEKAARAGFATKGVVYLILGILSLMAALGEGGQLAGGQQAVRTIGQQPFGQALLIVTGIGLAMYALWRFIQAALDPENKGTDGSGIAKRLGYAGSGFLHAALCYMAFQLGTGSGSGQGTSRQSLVASMLAEPFGKLVVAAIGLFILGAGIYQLVKAWKVKFREELKTGQMSAQEERVAIALGRAGLAARGVVFPIMGVSLINASMSSNPALADGIGGALRELSSQPFGTFLLVLVAAGLIAYGAYMFVNARYRRIPN